MRNFWLALLAFFCGLFILGIFVPGNSYAQTREVEQLRQVDNDAVELATDSSELATEEAELATEAAGFASPSAEELERLANIKREDITQPETLEGRSDFFELFSRRPIINMTWYNWVAFTVQYAVLQGLPANTIILILLLPFLATMVAFSRHVLGLPSLGILVTSALSVTLVATGITVGTILLATILFASVLARLILKKVRIMQMPKMALSVLVVAVCVFGALLAGASANFMTVKQLSIFPVLLLILLSERIVALQLERSLQETALIAITTLGLGILGFFLLAYPMVRQFILLYPEFIGLLIPVNFIIGRYFGLRLTEYFRFSSIGESHAS